MTDETSKRFSHLKFGVRTDVGRKRHNNEDAHGEWPAQGVFCVADGMGGAQDGEVASRAVIESLAGLLPRWSAFDPPLAQEDRLEALARGVNAASAWIKAYADSQGKKGCGSTFVGICLDPGDPAKATALHAGDSRVYRVRGRKIVQITRDHSVAEMAGVKDEKQLSPMFRSLILRAVGIKPSVEIERTPVDVEPGDRFVICSDGLSRMVPDKEIAKLVAAADEPDAAADALVDRANELGGKDNVTAVVLFAGQPASGPAGVRARLSPDEMAALFAVPVRDGDSATQETDASTRSEGSVFSIPRGIGAFDTSSGEFFMPENGPVSHAESAEGESHAEFAETALAGGGSGEAVPPPVKTNAEEKRRTTEELPVPLAQRRHRRGTPRRTAALAALFAAALLGGMLVARETSRLKARRAAAAEAKARAEEEQRLAKEKAGRMEKRTREAEALHDRAEALKTKIGNPTGDDGSLRPFPDEERDECQTAVDALRDELDRWRTAAEPDDEPVPLDVKPDKLDQRIRLRETAAGAESAAADLAKRILEAETSAAVPTTNETVQAREKAMAALDETGFLEEYLPFKQAKTALAARFGELDKTREDRFRELEGKERAQAEAEARRKAAETFEKRVAAFEESPTPDSPDDMKTLSATAKGVLDELEKENLGSETADAFRKRIETKETALRKEFEDKEKERKEAEAREKKRKDDEAAAAAAKAAAEAREKEKLEVRRLAEEEKQQALREAEEKARATKWTALFPGGDRDKRKAFFDGTRDLAKQLHSVGLKNEASELAAALLPFETDRTAAVDPLCETLRNLFAERPSVLRPASAALVEAAGTRLGVRATERGNGLPDPEEASTCLSAAATLSQPGDPDKDKWDSLDYFATSFGPEFLGKATELPSWTEAFSALRNEFGRPIPGEMKTGTACLKACFKKWTGSGDAETAAVAAFSLARLDAPGGPDDDDFAIAIAGFEILFAKHERDLFDGRNGNAIRDQRNATGRQGYLRTVSAVSAALDEKGRIKK